MTTSYEIRVKGRLGPEMLYLLADLAPETGSGSTLLHTQGIDQPSLHGTLVRIRDLGLEIDGVEKVEQPSSPDETETSGDRERRAPT
jgi:hypothetical protein